MRRLEAFADGVFAIAATLLILNVDTQVSDTEPLTHQLLLAWPSYAGYVVSFVTIGIIWVNHHTVLSQIDRTDRMFLFLNVTFLMCVAFIPFPTRLIAEHIRDAADARPAAFAYGATLTVTAVMFTTLWFYAARGNRLLRDDHDPAVVRGISRTYRPGSLIYLTATLVALVSPVASAVLYAVIAAVYVLESSIFGRSRRPA
jgi:uncharacterized membrane protein